MSQDRRKPDAQKFLDFLDELKQAPWLSEQRKRWPDFLFHFSDIKNAVSILKHGFLLSRAEVERQRIDFADSASSKIIGQTDATLTDYVRLYFRPRTPTTYHMEGFKPLNKRYEDAHCPVPIYFLFDMREIITLRDTRFSNGNLASGMTSIFTSADQFTQLPFKDIYHNHSLHGYSDEDKQYITTTKQAEVIYPKRISLDHLKFIYCRSQAEYETLQNLLPSAVWKKWGTKVIVDKGGKLFSKEWLYIEDVTLTNRSTAFDFHLPIRRKDYGPFKIRADLTDPQTRRPYCFEQEYSNIVAELENTRLNLGLSGINISEYVARVSIDGKLAYLGRYTSDNIPF